MTVFAGICYAWATIGIGSRIAMGAMGTRWKEWELKSAYKSTRPAWVVWLAIFGIALIGATWYLALKGSTDHAWIVATLLSLTAVKVGAFLFRYDQFRRFVSRVLSDKKKMAALNVAVIVFSGALIALGALLYS
jgi:hypothetical protein